MLVFVVETYWKKNFEFVSDKPCIRKGIRLIRIKSDPVEKVLTLSVNFVYSFFLVVGGRGGGVCMRRQGTARVIVKFLALQSPVCFRD